jgi:uncharacterized membrane protein YdjX (TVP38/TMEM64 family)
MKSKAGTLDSPEWFNIGSVVVTRRRAITGLGVVVMLAVVAMFWRSIDMHAIHEHAERMPAVWAMVLIVLLPLVGFPVSWLHIAAGVRFDFWPGLAVVLVTSLIQNALAWSLVQIVPTRYFKRLDPWRKKLEGAGHRDAILFCGLVPGLPYAVQLYLLPVIGVPLRSFCVGCALLTTVRASATILLGKMSDDLSPTRIAWLAAYYTILTGTSFYILRRLRRSLTLD